MRALRVLIAAAWISGIASVGVLFALEPTLPEPLREYLEREMESEPSTVVLVALGLGAVAFALFVWGSYLLWQPRRRGRAPFLAGGALAVGVTPLFGPVVMDGWSFLLYDLSSALTGVVVGWIFLAPDSIPWVRDDGDGPDRAPLPPLDAGERREGERERTE